MNPKILGSPKILGAPEKIASGLPAVAEKTTQSFRSIVRSIAWQETQGVPGYINYGKTFRLNISYESSIQSTTRYYWLFLKVDDEDAKIAGKSILSKRYELGKGTTYLDISKDDIGNVKQGSVLTADLRQDLGDFSSDPSSFIASVKIDILETIPMVMENKKWSIGQQCMEQWFRFDDNTPKSNLNVSNILKMKWAKNQWREYYKDINALYSATIDHLKKGDFQDSSSITISEAANNVKEGKDPQTKKFQAGLILDNLKDCLIPNKLFVLPTAINETTYCKFETADTYKNVSGSSGLGNIICEKFVIGAADIKVGYRDDMADFYAAVATCQLKVVAFANVSKISDKQFDAHIYMYGLFILDTYDFIDSGVNKLISQPLGYWDVFQNNASKTPIGSNTGLFALINNASFNEWKSRHKRGQNYNNYSDIEYIKLDKEQLLSFDENFNMLKFIV